MNCYQFPDRKTFYRQAELQSLLDEEGNLIKCTHERSIDEIGPIFRGGRWDPETGDVIEPPAQVDGWHVNAVGIAPPEWEEFRVTPKRPVRVFAGCE